MASKVWVSFAIIALACVAARASATDVHARNVDFLMGLLGWPAPSTVAQTLHAGPTTVGAAVDLAATRAADADLYALYNASQGAPTAPLVGTSWVLEVGYGPCTTGTQSESSAEGELTMLISRTVGPVYTKFADAGFIVTGKLTSDCATFDGIHLAFPFVDGAARLN